MMTKSVRKFLALLFLLVSIISFLYINLGVKNEKSLADLTKIDAQREKIEKNISKNFLELSIVKKTLLKLVDVILVNA